MTCPSADELARAVAEPDTPPAPFAQQGCKADEARRERNELLEHVAGCPRCRDLLERMDTRLNLELLSGTGSEQGHEPKAWFMDRLKTAVRFTVGGPPDREEIGPPIPGYAIEEEIARGGMGVVYRACDLTLGRTVAIKVVRPEFAARPDQLNRFVSEGKGLAAIQHPNVVQLFQVGEVEGQPFLVMEYVAGGTLRHALRTGPWDAHAAARLVRTLADAVAAAHRIGIVHRDLKPGNILLGKDEGGGGRAESKAELRDSDSALPLPPSALVPKVADFGLARFLDSKERRTQTGEVLGTPEFMAPEQARGDNRCVGPETDVWALGAVLYEVLTGRPPFVGTNPLVTLAHVEHAEPVPPDVLRPGVPPELVAVCLKCLEKNPHRRYRTAVALRDDLDRFLAGQPVVALPRSWAGRFLTDCRRHPRRVLGSLLVAAVVIGSVAFAVRERLTLRDAEARHAVEVARLREHSEVAIAELYAARIVLVGRAVAEGRVKDAEATLAAIAPLPGEPDLRGWEWHYLSNRLRGPAQIDMKLADAHRHGFDDVHLVPTREATSPDQRRRATIDAGGKLVVHDAAGRLLLELPRLAARPIGVKFSRDGRWLAVRTEGDGMTAFDGDPGAER